MMFTRFFHIARQLNLITKLATTRGTTGGLIKRIDENRELMELLQREALALLTSHPWLVGWIDANDQFFVQLDAILKTPRSPHLPCDYPRPWPIRKFTIEDAPEIALSERV